MQKNEHITDIEQPVRILHVLGRLNRGGAETMIMNIYREVDRSKIQFDFIIHTEDKCDYDDEIRELGGKIYNFPRYSGVNHFSYKDYWRAFFRRHPEYRIIHGHMRSTATIYLRIAKKFELTTIAHSHSISSGSGTSAIVKNIFQYPIRFIADYLFACSESAGIWLYGERACRRDNFFIINNSIDAKKFLYDRNTDMKIRGELGIEGKFVIGHIGRFAIPKNHEFLLDIFKSVHEKFENAVLLLVGDGELRESIEKKVVDLELQDNVIFTGKQSEIYNLLHTMDIFVFPSFYEGLGLVVIEAQASGLRCIVSDKIPKEAFITDLVEVISLKEKKDRWVNKIVNIAISHKTNERKNTYKQILSSGYDIKSTTEWLHNFYLQASK
ncbi:glycosyltransferase family 1 protein [Litchfieldia salsa]|uniref:Glycosyltransferase involved in cell wall bisynthesis n=1 Tax=Litchfieldia salsa TaxID=930152 RepID=A0A1H0W6G2_9BACI|nr:glycosyltransferase family 1 protein [Litchfieldia salsa]SDP86362.1 Glycosyltransferase involved in cell wall bisynthesis [Litchfieldia salsa]